MSLKTPEGDVIGDQSIVVAKEKLLIRKAASIPELAKEYGLSESLLYGLANESRLPGCRRVGSKRFLVHLETFDAWLADGQGE